MRKIVGIMAALSFILMCGFVGGMDRDLISSVKGFIGALIFTAVFAVCMFILGVEENG